MEPKAEELQSVRALEPGRRIPFSLISGQCLSAVNGKGLSIALGYVISDVCLSMLAIIGIRFLHVYERYVRALGLLNIRT